jgi:hypothetical protein
MLIEGILIGSILANGIGIVLVREMNKHRDKELEAYTLLVASQEHKNNKAPKD